MTKKNNLALPPQFNKMKRPPAKTSLAMKRSIERAKELYPEGFKWKTLVSNVRSTENIDN